MKKAKMANDTYKVYLLIWSNIRRFQYLNGLTDKQISESLGITTRTLYTYDKNPSALTLEKIQQFLEHSGLDMQALINL